MAALHARRQGAAFALVAELKPGRPAAIELRLIESDGGIRRDSTTLPFPGDAGELEAAVMRLDEQARRVRLTQPSVTRVPAPALGAISVAPVVREVARRRPCARQAGLRHATPRAGPRRAGRC